MIRIEHLYKTYSLKNRIITALKDINLEVNKGEIFGIIGRSGAGKSSLLRCLNLLERPTQGSIFIDGQDITCYSQKELHQLRQRTGMVFQHFNLFNAKTVAANIEWPLKIAGTYSAEHRQQRVEELLALVGLSHHRHQYPAQLSGGQKQRVGIARALATYPQLLLCDEATSALDPETTQSILQLLLDINRKLQLTIVLITHEMDVIRTICDRVAVIDQAEIVESGTVADVFLHPHHAVTQSLVAHSHTLELDSLGLNDGQVKGTLLRLTFMGDVTYQPILSQVTAKSTAHISILHGTIARIKNTPYGQLVVGIQGSSEEISGAIALLNQQQISCEVL